MLKTIKTVSFIIAISLAFTTISCLNDEDERTPEMEAAELTEVLNNLEAEGYNIDTTALGIYYIIHEAGTDTLPQAGDTCSMEYTGYLLDGIIFDTSHDHFSDGIWEFIYLDMQLIPGFDDGIALMGKGTEMDMLIPSSLAYGAQGSDIIKPYTPLRFYAKMHDLKQKY